MSHNPSKPINTNEVPLTVLSILTVVCIALLPSLCDCSTWVSPAAPLSLPVPVSSLYFWESPVFYTSWKQLCSLSFLITGGWPSFQAGPCFGGVQSLSLRMMCLWSLIPIGVRWWQSWSFNNFCALFCHLHPEAELFVLSCLLFLMNIVTSSD